MRATIATLVILLVATSAFGHDHGYFKWHVDGQECESPNTGYHIHHDASGSSKVLYRGNGNPVILHWSVSVPLSEIASSERCVADQDSSQATDIPPTAQTCPTATRQEAVEITTTTGLRVVLEPPVLTDPNPSTTQGGVSIYFQHTFYRGWNLVYFPIEIHRTQLLGYTHFKKVVDFGNGCFAIYLDHWNLTGFWGVLRPTQYVNASTLTGTNVVVFDRRTVIPDATIIKQVRDTFQVVTVADPNKAMIVIRGASAQSSDAQISAAPGARRKLAIGWARLKALPQSR